MKYIIQFLDGSTQIVESQLNEEAFVKTLQGRATLLTQAEYDNIVQLSKAIN